jgi:hypothetical protein
MPNRSWVTPLLAVALVALAVGLLILQARYYEWVRTTCDSTKEIRIVEDYPTYMDVAGDGTMMIPVGGGAHEERLWLCHEPERRVWLRD